MRKIKIDSFNFLVGKREEIINCIKEKINKKEGFVLLPTSLNDLASVDANKKLSKSYQKVNICVTDGMPLVWFFNFKNLLKGRRFDVNRVYGPHLMRDLLENGKVNTRHFFYGSSEETIEDLGYNIKKIFPKTKIVGMVSPPFRKLSLAEEANYILQIKKSRADVLWIGLSSPKQVVLASRWSKLLPNVSIMCVGAAFDFLADRQIMAPKIIQKLGLEWLFRLLVNPRRFWKRYLIVIPRFIIRKIYFFLN